MSSSIPPLAVVLLCVLGCDSARVVSDVAYDPRYGEATSLDIYLPPDAVTGGARPAVMMIHGGAWRYGDKESYAEAAERFAEAGFVTASINYRLVPAGVYPGPVQDCLCALSFLRANADAYGIDPDRIAVTGYSAGGHLSSLIGVAAAAPEHQPDCVWGPTAPPAAVIPGATSHDMREDNAIIRDFMGGSIDDMPELYAAASPIVHVAPGAPPYLIVHGGADVVDVDGAIAMHAALLADGNEAYLLELRGAGHVLNPGTDSGQIYLEAATDLPEAWAATIDFLDRTLGGAR